MRATVADILHLIESPKPIQDEKQSPECAWAKCINYAIKRDNDDLIRLISAIATGGDHILKEVASLHENDFSAFAELIQQVSN